PLAVPLRLGAALLGEERGLASRRATRPDEAARGRSGAGTPVPGKGRTRTGAAGKGATSSGATGKGAAGRVPSKRQAKPPKPRARPSDGPPPPPLGEPGEAIRLQRVLSAAGVASRRAAEDLITSGRVSVDGKVVRTLGTRVDPETARIEVDGERIGVRRNRQYLIMNKPVGVITSASDPFGRKTVLDLVRVRGRVFPVGRLDSDTSGLLLLTDDGELAHRLAHPRYGIEKVYVAKVAGRVETATLKRLEKGIRLDDGPARAVRARLRGKASKTSQVEIVMAEGRKREVRRMLEAVGHPVDELVRVAYGPIRLSGLVTGDVRELTIAEIGELYRLVGL
ncbi:MAG TPA: pseudouridine synthase, partial [Actinomycetota bacterium]|nr:pseudouridine synthase [Actinomycetota bacterium]